MRHGLLLNLDVFTFDPPIGNRTQVAVEHEMLPWRLRGHPQLPNSQLPWDFVVAATDMAAAPAMCAHE